MAKGSWLLVEELLERADPAFVDELRKFDDAERLGAFALTWFADRRPHARSFLFDYLRRPLNAIRHEPLVKRLFKLAEQAGDDELMAHFLVLFDRSLRRIKRRRFRHAWQQLDDRAAAMALVAQWEADGAVTTLYEWNDNFNVSGRWPDEQIVLPWGTTMPRGRKLQGRNPRTGASLDYSELCSKVGWRGRPPASLHDLPEPYRTKLEGLRLFTVHTRHYLRRRAWRYFRRLGKQHPDRYVPAVVRALLLYDDADTADGLALLDNWGLMHVLFHRSPAIVAKTNGWTVVPEHTLAELAPAPIFEPLWLAAPHALLGLLKDAACRPVRQWAIRLVKRDGGTALKSLPLDELFALLGHPDDEVVAVAADVLRERPGLDAVPLERWLALLETPNTAALEVVCELMTCHLRAESATLAQALRLASARPVPVARLGLHWLQGKQPRDEAECRAVLELAEAPAASVRPDLIRWARAALSAAPLFQASWLLELLDSRHADVRAEGWAWLEAEPRARDDVEFWRKLLESPYDDVRLRLVAELEKRVAGQESAWQRRAALDASLLRLLWASVLLNIHRGGRAKPLVVRQLVQRLRAHPDEAKELLPIVAVALRSVRGPEWRAGLAAVVELAENSPDLEPAVRQAFPELRLTPVTNHGR